MLSSIYLNATLIITTIIIIAGLLTAMDELVSSSYRMREMQKTLKQLHATGILQAGFNYTNLTDEDRVDLYFRNTGSTVLKTSCLDLFIDGYAIERENLTNTLLDTTFDPDLWNPDEILEVETLTDLDVGEHTAKLATCNGAQNEGKFNASRCADNLCTGGEYCHLDNSSCPDRTCYDPTCWNGCTETPISNDIDQGECDSNNAAGNCLSTPCECGPTSICCGLNLADCTTDQNCCPGYECGAGNKCRTP